MEPPIDPLDINYKIKVDVAEPYLQYEDPADFQFVGPVDTQPVWEGPIQPQGPQQEASSFPWWILIAGGVLFMMTSGKKSGRRR